MEKVVNRGIDSTVELLKKEAMSDKMMRDIFHVMSLRERARNIITVGGLDQRMKKEGFNYERADYVKFLKFMASVGFGKLETDSKGKVLSLKDIRITLQSIGEAAMGQNTKLIPWKQRNKYQPLPEQPKPQAPQKASADNVTGFPVSLTVVVNGKPVNFRIPKELTEWEIADLVVRFRDSSPEKSM